MNITKLNEVSNQSLPLYTIYPISGLYLTHFNSWEGFLNDLMSIWRFKVNMQINHNMQMNMQLC